MVTRWTLDTSTWHRAGRGSELQFYATDEEVQRYLLEGLPGEHGGYALVGADKVLDDGAYVDRPFEYPITELAACMSGGDGYRTNLWIWPRALVPALRLSDEARVDRMCSLAGLILLQHGFVHKGERDASCIGIVDRVRHVDTGEVVRHVAQRRVYDALASRIRRDLCYSTVRTFPDGRRYEETRQPLMTAGAAALSHAGTRFTRQPGRLIDERARR